MTEIELIKRIEELEAKQIETDRRIEIMMNWINDNVPKKPMMFEMDGPIMNREAWLKLKEYKLNER
jgi:hypothetical protein